MLVYQRAPPPAPPFFQGGQRGGTRFRTFDGAASGRPIDSPDGKTRKERPSIDYSFPSRHFSEALLGLKFMKCNYSNSVKFCVKKGSLMVCIVG